MSIPKFNISNADLLDKLKEGFGYKTDLEIASFLGVTSETVSQVRRGLMGLSIIQRLKIMDRLLSIHVRDLLIKIAPENLATELHRLSLLGAENLAFNRTESGEATARDIELIDLFKEFGKFRGLFTTDKQVADYLGLKRNTISAVRKGDSRLGPLPRLRILKAINPTEDIEQIERGIESSEFLLTLISEHIEKKQLIGDETMKINSDSASEVEKPSSNYR